MWQVPSCFHLPLWREVAWCHHQPTMRNTLAINTVSIVITKDISTISLQSNSTWTYHSKNYLLYAFWVGIIRIYIVQKGSNNSRGWGTQTQCLYTAELINKSLACSRLGWLSKEWGTNSSCYCQGTVDPVVVCVPALSLTSTELEQATG